MKSSSAMSDIADLTVTMGNDEVFSLTKGLPMGTSFELSTLVFLEALIGEIVFDKTKPDGNPRKLLDSSLINSLGWSSETNLDEGLKKTYDWFQKEFT